MKTDGPIFPRFLLFLCIFLVFSYIHKGYSQERLIGPGDVLEIIVYGHQELSRMVEVNSQGSIDFPFLQDVPVDGLTLEKLRDLLVVQLSRFLETRPVVTVNFAEEESMTVMVNGQVRKPGVLNVPIGTRLQGAIGTAGGFVDGANLQEVILLRKINGKTRQFSFDVGLFLSNGDMKENPVLKENDEVIVTGNPVYTEVKVLGSVRIPGSYPYFHGATILDMLFQAGGIEENTEIEKIHYISAAKKRSYELDLDLEKYYRAPATYRSIKVQPGDIIIVEEDDDQLWKTVMSTVRDLAMISTLIYWVVRIDKI